MVDMRAGEQARKFPQQPQPARRAPSARIRSGRRRDRPCGAIIILPPVNLLLLKARKRQGRRSHSPAPSSRCGKRQVLERARRKDAENIARLAQRLKRRLATSPTSAAKSQTQQIDEIEFAARVPQPNHVAGRRAPLRRASIVCSTPRVVKSRRKELPVPSGRNPSAGRPCRQRLGKKPVDDFVGRSVAADGEKIPEALRVGAPRERGGFAGAACLHDFQFDARCRARDRAQPAQACRSARRPPPDSRWRRKRIS